MTNTALSPSQVILYAATTADYQIALGASAIAGIPIGNVIGNYSSAWNYVSNGNYLVIAVGGPALNALKYNPCGWSNPTGMPSGHTPFALTPTFPVATLPGANHFENAAGVKVADTLQLASAFAYYAVHGVVPSDFTNYPTPVSPVSNCAGHADVACPCTPASPGYLPAGSSGLHHLFLAYMGNKVTSTGGVQPQDWQVADFQPVLTHINLTTNTVDSSMFTQYLFLPFTVQDTSGVYKWIGYTNNFPSGSAPAGSADWQTYIHTLLASNQNIGALYENAIASGNGLNENIPVDVWVTLPYPYTTTVGSDQNRSIALQNWVSSFVSQWQASGYANVGSPLKFRGFYWDAESVINTDATVIQNINNYVRSNTPYSTLWIPYTGANQWPNWSKLEFSAAILQPNYYFNANKSIQTGVYNAYSNGEGVELEMDLAVTRDPNARARFIDYLNYGVTGGTDSNGHYFPPYMSSAAHAWYSGGWYPIGTSRQEAMVQLYQNRDPLYDHIHRFIHGSYVAGSAQ